MHTNERVFHTRDHRLRLGPDRGADAGAVSAAPVCSSARPRARLHGLADSGRHQRSEEHTSELQSRLHLVCRLLLEKKKILSPFPLFLMTSIDCLTRSPT